MLKSEVWPEQAPALPKAERMALDLAGARRLLLVLLPPLLLMVTVLGSIFLGIATPTEAGAFGGVGAILLAAINGRLRRSVLSDALEQTTTLTSMVLMLLIGSTLFALVFRGLNGDLWVEGLLMGLPGGRIGLLVLANLVIFGLGFFIDFFEIAFILLPLIVPAARGLGIEGAEMVWFGVVIAMNLQTSFLTPPFGFSLFYLRGVAPSDLETRSIYRGVIPFIGLQVVALSLVVVYPELVTYFLSN